MAAWNLATEDGTVSVSEQTVEYIAQALGKSGASLKSRIDEENAEKGKAVLNAGERALLLEAVRLALTRHPPKAVEDELHDIRNMYSRITKADHPAARCRFCQRRPVQFGILSPARLHPLAPSYYLATPEARYSPQRASALSGAFYVVLRDMYNVS